jgi:hypothetical protein
MKTSCSLLAEAPGFAVRPLGDAAWTPLWNPSLVKSLIFLLMFAIAVSADAREINLIQNPGFELATGAPPKPDGYAMTGSAFWGLLGSAIDFATYGVIFPGHAEHGGAVSQMVQNIDQSKGRWISFRFRGLAEHGFVVSGETLKMKIEFYSKNGANYLDCATRPIDGEIEMDRKNLTVNGDYHKGGAAVWRSYELEELIPFQEVDAVKVSVSYANGAATTPLHAAFLIDDFSLVQRSASLTGRIDPGTARPSSRPGAPADQSNLISLGGRWYYQPLSGETAPSASAPLTVTEENADRLFYKSDRMLNPFLNNMTAWLRAGYKDEVGNIVTKDQFVPDNVVLTFKGDGFLTLKARNLPNHPTARFPGFNPSYIQEFNRTYRLPLDPVPNPKAVAMNTSDRNGALPMGGIGLAVNGVVFYNPFDAMMTDASSIMDYCCGHPSPDNRYHYHKYPICVNTPFVDKGDAHSEVIGFAFDGFPIYGPYEAAGVMAKDSTSNPLNAFNACYDKERGWHYHVTPGKFPYIIGGFFGNVETSNLDHHGAPGGRRPPFGGQRPPLGPPQF